ncbi:MAG: response regulator [Desulfobulbaceae bacterium]|nr:response regulator [Desulfobulbaceae bacterium]
MIKKQQSPFLVKYSIGRKFAVIITFLSLLAGGLILFYLQSINTKNALDDYKRMIERLHVSSEIILLKGLWLTNEEVIETVISGFSNLPGVEEVALEKEDGSLIKKGQTVSKEFFRHEHELVYDYRGNALNLGNLSITVGLDSKRNQIIHETIYLALLVGIWAILGGAVTIFLFYWIVGRHLQSIASYCQSLDWQNLTDPLVLERKIKKNNKDELDQIVNSLNATCTVLSKSLSEIQENETLLIKITENYPNSYVSIIEKDFTVALIAGQEFKKQNINPKKFEGLHIDDIFANHATTDQRYAKTFEGEEQSFELVTNNEHQLYKTVPLPAEDGSIPRILVVCENITERKELEVRLQQSQKMEAIGTLAGGIAHDFNNILSAILGYAEMAKDDSQPESTVAKDLDKVLEAGNRAKDLVQQILSFSRQGEVESIPLQPVSIVKEAIKMLRPSLPTTIEINQNIASTTSPIFADPTQIHQILMNLCTNAFHVMEETGGKLEISLKEVILSSEDLFQEPNIEPGTFIQLSVCDSGPGLTPDIKARIFDPYFTTKETGKGTGMGLAIVHGIVNSYGGFISLYSELGEGTAFHVFLPVIEKEVLAEIEVVEQIPVGEDRILFIDDEEILAEMGKDMLERLGYHVTVRNNSIEALETFQNQPDQFDLIITDQTMPGMTGADIARRMIQIRPDIPIILCTGYSTIMSEEKAKSMGIKEFALKPLSKKDIAVLIRKVLDNN